MAWARTGTCGCGTVRYRLASEPFDTGWCHCRTCQLSSGSPGLVFATVPVAAYVVTAGADSIGSWRSSGFGTRRFCRNCGTPLTMQVDHQPDTIDFTVATLDHPEDVVPGYHIFHAEALPWAETVDALPRHAGFRPDTRGLNQETKS